MTITAYLVGPAGTVTELDTEDSIRDSLVRDGGLLWVDILEPREDSRALLQDGFGFHHLSVDACIDPEQYLPKAERFGDHLFIIAHGINYNVESTLVETTGLHLFIGEQFVVSCHSAPLFSVEAIKRRVADGEGDRITRSPAFLAHALIDALVDNVMRTIDRMREVAENLEMEVIESPDRALLESVTRLKRSALRLQRVISPERIVFERLGERERPLINDEAGMYFRDLSEQIHLIEGLLMSTSERADNVMAAYLSSVSIKQNESMRVLSLVAVVFLPLTLLVGVYGMNFENMPELDSEWGYFAVLTVIGLTLVSAVAWVWTARWVAFGRRASRRAHQLAVEPHRLVGYVGDLTHHRHK